MFQHPVAQETIQLAANERLRAIEAHVEALAADRLRAAEELQDRIGARMRDVEADLDKRVTVSKLASTPVIKELKTSLDKLRATNEDLETRLKELEKGPRR